MSGVLNDQLDPHAGGDDAMILDDVRAVRARHTADLFALPHVIGVGIGLDDAGFHITVYLDATIDGVPTVLDGVPVKTVVCGRIVAS